MIILNLKRKSALPLFMQIFFQVKRLIEENTLKPGFHMPSTRTLAEKHGVNRSTVYKAYEELWAMGYIESRPGSYSIVRKRQRIVTPEQKSKKGLIPWEALCPDTAKTLYQTNEQLNENSYNSKSNVIDLASLDLDPRLFPLEDFRRCVNTVLVEKGSGILRYGDCKGYKPLRETIAERLCSHGISVN
ncbi:MAG: GntR family transcriptional regulator, partial [bacterium]|nr:GntR family transcriptional regulator [bacterium]